MPFLARRLSASLALIPMVFVMMSGMAAAQLKAPDAVNDLPIKPNPTATVTKVCEKLGEKEYPMSVHASCYSEINQAVVVMVSGNAGDVSGLRIGKHIIEQFKKSHVPATAFLRFKERNKVAIVFLLNGDAYGPYSGKNWKEGFEEVKHHAPQAWFR